MKADEFSTLFALIRGAFPQQVVTRETVEAYWFGLQDLRFSEAKQAVMRHVRSSKFWPAIADIANGVAEASANVTDAATIAAEAWDAAFSRGLQAGPGEVSDAAKYAIATVGWQALCDCDSERRGTLNAQLIKAAASFRQRKIDDKNFSSAAIVAAIPVPTLGRPEPRLVGEILRETMGSK